MASLETDVLVIGGGATGAGVAWDSALRGFDTILVDRADLAEGTSGRFHGLLHSGGRYVVKDPVAAVECVEENAILREVIPDCIEDTGGLFVVTPDDDPEYGDRFLEGCATANLPTEEISVGEALKMEPRLNPGIKRAFTVPDGSIDAWKTVWALARGASAHGARILTYHKVVDLTVDGDAVTGARLRNELTGEELDVAARFTLNASGAWAAQVVKMAGIEGVGVIPGKGIMIAMNHRLVNTVVNRCTMPADGDILVPIRTVSVIGTTDIRAADPDEIPVTQEEVDAMLDDGERLVPGFRDARALRVWAGVRPLFQDEKASGKAEDTRDVSRTHAVVDHMERDGIGRFLTMSGGKLTTLPPDGAGHRRRHVPPARRGPPVPHRDRAPARQRGRRALHDRLAPAPPRVDAAGRAAHLRVRADRPPQARGDDAAARNDEPRRRAPLAAARHGSVPGRLLHLPRHRHPARGRPSRPARRRPSRCAASCRSAGRACGRSSTATSCGRRGSTTGSSRACSTWSTCA